MYRFLLSRQWVILTLIGLLLMPAMIELGFWQYHRHERRVSNNQLIADSLAARPVPVGSLTRPGADVPMRETYRSVTATGRYDTAHEVVVRRRTAADRQSIGYHVLTPLLVNDGRTVLINRGWIPATGNLTAFPDIPAAPSGEVTVTGRLRPDETSAFTGIKDKAGLPDRQIMLINSEQPPQGVTGPVLGGYLELTGTSPEPAAEQPEFVPPPDHESIGAHMAYAIQWWLFTSMVPVGWVVLVRRERGDIIAARTKDDKTPPVPVSV